MDINIAASTGDEMPASTEGFNTMGTVSKQSDKAREQQVADRTKELAILNSIAQTASQSLELEPMLTATLDKVLELLEFESGAIYIKDLETDELNMACHRGLSHRFRRVAAKGIISVRAVQSGEPVIIHDLLQEPDAPKAVVAEGYRSVVSIPLLSKGQVQGVLTTASRQLRHFHQKDVNLLLSIGHQIGVAIENARLFDAEQRRSHQFRVISEVGARITSILPVDELLMQIARLVQEAFDYHHVGIGLIEGDEVFYNVGAGPLWDDREDEFQPRRLKVGQHGMTGWVAGTGEPLLARDVSQEPHYVKMPGSRTRSEVAVPIRAKGKVIGVLDAQSDRLNAFDESDLTVLQSLADQAAMAIENARFFEGEQRRAEQLRLMYEVGRRMTSILDIDVLLDQMLRMIQEAFDYYLVEFGLIHEDEVVTRARAGRHRDSESVAARLKVGQEGIVGWVAGTGEPLLVPDVSQEPRYVRLADVETRSELAVPVKAKGEIIGVLNVESDRLNAFDESDLTVLQSLADQAAMAIENARLYQDTRSRLAQVTALQETTKAVASTLELDTLLSLIIQQATTLLQADAGIINLVDWEKNEDEALAGTGWAAGAVGLRISLEDSLSGWVARHNEPVISNRPQDDSRVRRRTISWVGDEMNHQIRSIAMAPLTIKEQVIGTLVVTDKQGGKREFSQTDLELLVAFANQAAAAIENARLFDDEQRRAEQFRAISEMGRHMTSILDVDELLDEIVRLIKATLGYYLVSIALIEGDELVFKTGVGPRWDDPHFEPIRVKVGEEGITGWVAGTGQSLLAPDVSQEPRYISLADPIETRSELAVPLKAKGEIVGVLNVESDRLNAFDESDLAVLQSLADQAAIAIQNARLYEQAQQLAVVEERQRLARELHDSVTQSLYSVTLFSEAARRLAEGGGPEGVQSYLEQLGEASLQALKEMRLLVYQLRPSALERQGLVAALQQRLEAVEGRAGVEARLQLDGDVELPTSVEDGLYRIAQEGLNNALKHSVATSVTVSLRADGQRVELEVEDNGRGFDPEAVSDRGGMGLISMRERAEALGGSLSVLSAPGEGTRVRVEVPQ